MENSSTSNSEAAATARERGDLRRFLLRYVLPFVLLFAAFCIGYDYLLREKVIFQTSIQGVAKIHRIYEHQPGEYPIIGSSRALGSYIPDSIHPAAYNYGINGIGYPVMDMLLQKALAWPQEQGPIILNWDYEMFIRSVGDPNNYIALSHEPEIRALLKRAEMYSIAHELNGLRFFDAFDLYMREFLNQRLQLTKWITKGASIEKDPVTHEEIQKLIKRRLSDPPVWAPEAWMIDSLFHRVAQRPDRKWNIVVSPYHDSYYQAFPPQHFREARQLMARLDALPNVRVIDISGRGWADTLFVNTTHINLPGAIRFSRELRMALADSTALPFQP